jgi:hypothetical protein
VDIFVGGSASSAAQGNDDVHNCNDVKPSITLTATNCSIIATISQGTHPLSSSDFPGTVSFMLNGQPVSSAGVSASPSSVSYTAPDGTTSVTAQVTDSVLYQASATVSTPGCVATPATPPAPGNGNPPQH